tara:strand:+ start:189 stop:395 length:207 start_codon:yes stop_codon:yes gene_type:complete
MIDPKMKTLGMKDMHPAQVEALIDFVATSLNLAHLTNDQDMMDETEAAADELIRMFGGNGIKVTVDAY